LSASESVLVFKLFFYICVVVVERSNYMRWKVVLRFVDIGGITVWAFFS